MVHVLDLDFQGFQNTIAAFLISTNDGPVLIETGPHSCLNALGQKVEELGFSLKDIKDVFLTHIHLDHAGAAWALAEHGATVYVHPEGAPHMTNPSKLLNSAKRIYQDRMDSLWGDLQPINSSQVVAVQDGQQFGIGEIVLKAIFTPGHAKHHIAWKFEESIFCGDTAGIKIDQGPVMAPCPPPDINIEHWISSIELIRVQNPKYLFLTHFGRVAYDVSLLNELGSCLIRWSEWIREHWKNGKSIEEVTPVFQEYVDQELVDFGSSRAVRDRYQMANPAWMSVGGLFRYWTKQTGT